LSYALSTSGFRLVQIENLLKRC